MICITGDIHGEHGITRLSSTHFPDQHLMSKDTDYVIVAGDFGLVWSNSKEEIYWRNWIGSKNFTLLFVEGNHENHSLLDAMEVHEWHGGNVHFVTPNIIHLMRGQVYLINGLKFFTFGGAQSIDRAERKANISWWAREMPSPAEYVAGLANLEAHDFKVDYIITHDCSDRIYNILYEWGHLHILGKYKTHLSDFLEEIEEKARYRHWFFGHHHKSMEVGDKHTVLYKAFVRINENEPGTIALSF